MARQAKETVDYYPHFAKSGRTIFILESKFGNDGYAFWFKLLEILCDTNSHAYDCSNPSNWAYLSAKTRVSEEVASTIIDALISLGKIDRELWEENRIIWCQNLVDRLEEVYRKRTIGLPEKPKTILGQKSFPDAEIPENDQKSVKTEDFCGRNTQGLGFLPEEIDKEKERKGKERKSTSVLGETASEIVELWNATCTSLPKVIKISAARKEKIKTRLCDWGKTREEQIETACQLFERIEKSDFLTGRTGKDWKASFDWVFDSSKNWLKVMEGNYENNTSVKSPRIDTQKGLGRGEYLREDGTRTYGSGVANIPMSAPPRPSENYQWDAGTERWVYF